MTFANRIIHDEKLSTISSKIFPRPEAPHPIALITAAVKGIGLWTRPPS
ncbi:MAG: hypothetical protein J5846_02195 [Desulfovibrio sp.]|nr:hypothetical protein [Desulfovibrio sp.]